jgi:hypothetical protein
VGRGGAAWGLWDRARPVLHARERAHRNRDTVPPLPAPYEPDARLPGLVQTGRASPRARTNRTRPRAGTTSLRRSARGARTTTSRTCGRSASCSLSFVRSRCPLPPPLPPTLPPTQHCTKSSSATRIPSQEMKNIHSQNTERCFLQRNVASILHRNIAPPSQGPIRRAWPQWARDQNRARGAAATPSGVLGAAARAVRGGAGQVPARTPASARAAAARGASRAHPALPRPGHSPRAAPPPLPVLTGHISSLPSY